MNFPGKFPKVARRANHSSRFGNRRSGGSVKLRPRSVQNTPLVSSDPFTTRSRLADKLMFRFSVTMNVRQRISRRLVHRPARVTFNLRACLKSSGGPLACRRGRHLAARIGAGSREEIQVIHGSPTRLAPFPPGETPRSRTCGIGQDGRRYIFRQSLSQFGQSKTFGIVLRQPIEC